MPGLADVAPTPYDGDSPTEVRRFARERSRWIFSNPDMIHLSLLRNHARWAVFLRNLRYLVVDECHYYRGIFGSNVAMVLRRLLRLCSALLADRRVPTVIFASATTAQPAITASELIGQTVVEVTEDGSPQGARTVALWEPALLDDLVGENGAPVRRSAGAEAARVMADLIAEGARTLTFVRSRRGAELTALGARARLAETAPDLSEQVASYRAGYLAEDRRALERALADGELRGLATTNALELGVDIAGLDAVVLAGFPGTVASFWQQAGRAGRRGQGALVVLIARDDPLDTYLVHHPAALLDKPIERVVIDPANPYVLGPQLLCAATELPLTDAEVRMWNAEAVAGELVDDGLLRRRPSGYFPTPGVDPHPAVDIRGSTGGQIAILEADTGRMLGSAGAGQAPASVHPGAVYLHQGESYVVDSLDFEDGIAFVHAEDPGYTTFARELTDIDVTGQGERREHGPVTVGLVPVSVSNTVIGYLRRRLDGEVIDFVELDMPTRTLETMAVDVHDHTGSVAGQRNRSAPDTRFAARRRARRDRTAAAGRQLRPRRHRRGVHRGRPGRRTADDLRLRRLPRRRGLRRPRLPHDRAPGGKPRRRRSRRASARPAARRACSRPSAATATTRWTKTARSGCYAWFWARSRTGNADSAASRSTPRRSLGAETAGPCREHRGTLLDCG